MTLGELISALEAADSNAVVRNGFDHPHSYRGYYEDLAFEPSGETRVGDMLVNAEDALDKTFEGYKGGDYEMGKYTECWLASYGSCGETIGSLLLRYILADTVATDSEGEIGAA